MKKRCLVKKISRETGDELFLVETHGYGAAWSKLIKDAMIFESKQAAQDHIDAQHLHNAKPEVTK